MLAPRSRNSGRHIKARRPLVTSRALTCAYGEGFSKCQSPQSLPTYVVQTPCPFPPSTLPCIVQVGIGKSESHAPADAHNCTVGVGWGLPGRGRWSCPVLCADVHMRVTKEQKQAGHVVFLISLPVHMFGSMTPLFFVACAFGGRMESQLG